MIKLGESFRENLLFSTILIWVLRAQLFFTVLIDPLDPDPWIRIFFTDPDPGNQNVADPNGSGF